MAKVHQETIVTADVEKCFDFIADPEKAPLFVSSLHSVNPISVAPKGVGNSWNWEYDLFGLPLKGSAKCLAYERPNKYVWSSNEIFPSTWTYTFQKVDGGTKIMLDIEYEIPKNALTGKITDKFMLEKMNQQQADTGFRNLKTVLES